MPSNFTIVVSKGTTDGWSSSEQNCRVFALFVIVRLSISCFVTKAIFPFHLIDLLLFDLLDRPFEVPSYYYKKHWFMFIYKFLCKPLWSTELGFKYIFWKYNVKYMCWLIVANKIQRSNVVEITERAVRLELSLQHRPDARAIRGYALLRYLERDCTPFYYVKFFVVRQPIVLF